MPKFFWRDTKYNNESVDAFTREVDYSRNINYFVLIDYCNESRDEIVVFGAMTKEIALKIMIVRYFLDRIEEMEERFTEELDEDDPDYYEGLNEDYAFLEILEAIEVFGEYMVSAIEDHFHIPKEEIDREKFKSFLMDSTNELIRNTTSWNEYDEVREYFKKNIPMHTLDYFYKNP